ncbi:hypothetical protein VT84_01910 [Gemmata sp. SH-PL17]|uniref:hypothetical protein n=1 Tax=Gemmata sp. SH-PL17 TaxID=1630693 RepID=UPI0004B82A05|nr:hypothetical protein [Gemmata sp. SH-PL17]AMV23136.1 hypothetical protein VT84_01910 [Gemmata sp. SH-PL17]
MAWSFHRATVLGFAGVAVLAGVLVAMPVAAASDAPVTATAPRREMSDLVRMPKSELEALYLASPSATPPSGFVPGRAIKAPGSRFTVANSRATRLAWQGKIFRNDGTMINRVLGGARAIPADVYEGESLLDGQPSLILDYSRSKLWPDVRDELREVEPGLYLGLMYKGKPAQQKMFFTLDARK